MTSNFVLGVKDPSAINQDISLGDLGLDSLMGVEVKQVLERITNTEMPIKAIRQLNFKQLYELQAEKRGDGGTKQTKTKYTVHELAQRRYKLGQVMPTEVVVRLSNGMAGHEGDTPAFVTHPIEGGCFALEELASMIDVPVFGLQCTAQAPLQSMETLASHYIQVSWICSSFPTTIYVYIAFLHL